MLTRRHVLLAVATLLLAVGSPRGRAWQVQRDLDRASSSVDELRAAIEARDAEARDRTIAELKSAAQGAPFGQTDSGGSALTVVPILGDDAEGIRVLSDSHFDDLDQVSCDGRIE